MRRTVAVAVVCRGGGGTLTAGAPCSTLRLRGCARSSAMAAEEPMTGTATQQFVEVNGCRLFVEASGAGVPLLLLHGGIGSTGNWDGLVPHLVSAFRLLAVDSRGHGQSTNPSGTLTYGLMAQDVAALCTELRLERPILCGWSDGAQVALELELQFPGLAAALILVGTLVDWDAAFHAATRRLFGVDAAGRVDRARLATDNPDLDRYGRATHHQYLTHWETLAQQTVDMWLDYPGLTSEQLGQVRAPALVVLGDRDAFIPVDDGVRLHRALPDSELLICPAGSHSVMRDRPAIVAAAIVDFVGRRYA